MILSNKEKLREIGLFSLEKKTLCGEFITAFEYLKDLTRRIRTNILAGPLVIGQGKIVLETV